jgi:hypothetical protein
MSVGLNFLSYHVGCYFGVKTQLIITFEPLPVFWIKDECKLRNAESQLGIKVYIVVPGQPVGGVQLAVRECHHL